MAENENKASWKDIEANPEFQALDAFDKYSVREDFFNKRMAPEIPEDQRDAVRQDFYDKTHDRLFSMWDDAKGAAYDMGKIALNGLTFNLGDKALAAARAGFDSNLDYDQALAEAREGTRQARDRAGWAGTAMDVVSGVGLGAGMAARGATLVGREAIQNSGLLTRLGAAGLEGAGYGAAYNVGQADKGFDPVANAAAATEGAIYGGAGGLVGGAAGEGLSKAMRSLMGPMADTRVAVDGQRLNTGAQRVLDNALGGEAGDATANAMRRMGPDTLALNANDDLANSALAIAQEGGQGGRTVTDALRNQFGRRSDRILAGVDDALGPRGRDMNTILEGAEEAIADSRPEYTNLLKGRNVPPADRRPITDVVKEVRKSYMGSEVGNALKALEKVENWPADAHALLNKRNVTLDKIERNYPSARGAIGEIRKAVNKQLDKVTGGEFQKLQDIQSAAKSDIEAAKLATNFLDARTDPRDITSALTLASPQRRAMMREVARDSVDQTVRQTSNDITGIQKVVGRHANASQRENVRRVFGDEAESNLTRMVDNELKKSSDYAEIMRNSNTAKKQAARERLADDVGGFSVPQNSSPAGILSEAARAAMRGLYNLTGNRRGDAARAAIGKVATMNEQQLVNLLAAIRRAEQNRATVGRGMRSMAATVGNVQTQR